MKYISILMAFFLAACGEPTPEERQQELQNVELVREIDGCKVYVFVHALNNVYFSNCKGSTQAVGTEILSNGRNIHTQTRWTTTLNAGAENE
jgi:hypothetical protein